MGIVQPEPQNLERAFGQWVKDRRADRKMSQAELAASLTERGIVIDASAISRIESGDRSVRLSEADALALALGEVLLAPPIADRLSERTVAYDGIVRAADRLMQSIERHAYLLHEVNAVNDSILEARGSLELALTKMDSLDEDSVNYVIGRIGGLARRSQTRGLFDTAVARAKPYLSASFVSQWEAQMEHGDGEHPEAS